MNIKLYLILPRLAHNSHITSSCSSGQNHTNHAWSHGAASELVSLQTLLAAPSAVGCRALHPFLLLPSFLGSSLLNKLFQNLQVEISDIPYTITQSMFLPHSIVDRCFIKTKSGINTTLAVVLLA